ncbi:hypothetical protein BGX29_007627 [Mortierella sp. GBA35]|nr:hypothetical protein BGX29_007627 [Mortierella sp. GBA35]
MANIDYEISKELDLDALVHLENMFVNFGREDGMAAGERNGAIEGRVMGCEKGFELSREVGYYAGCAQLWKALAQQDPERISEKSLKKINSLLDLIETFPRQNQLDDDVIALLDRIRGKFKTVASALQTAERYVDAPKSKIGRSNNCYDDHDHRQYDDSAQDDDQVVGSFSRGVGSASLVLTRQGSLGDDPVSSSPRARVRTSPIDHGPDTKSVSRWIRLQWDPGCILLDAE